MHLRDRILSRLQRPDYVPEPSAVLLAKLGLKRKDRNKLDHELRLLESEGTIVRVKRDRYCLPSDADLVTGRIHFKQSGSAVLVPEPVPGREDVEPIDVSAEDTNVALHGDRVVVRLSDREPRKPARKRGGRLLLPARANGRVIRILERARETITGNLQKSRNFHYVVPDDPRIIHDI
ncbi:MAG: hypothetical protein ACREIA_24310 [Opitutaceae bacterium]